MSSRQHRYFTTPIYYASGDPHAGHFYTTLLANVMKLHFQGRGDDVRVLTGMDEHGEKVAQAAAARSQTPQQFVDQLAAHWQQCFADLALQYDVFQRTTDPSHIKNVQDILTRCHAKGDIYYGEHRGLYCVHCESFLTDADMDENKNCLTHQKPTELRVEENYFFKTTKYREALLALLHDGKIARQNKFRNELLAMTEGLTEDLSISRPRSRTDWGIPLPFDDKHVAYVWFDALPNYVTGVGGVTAAGHSPYWANCFHLIGKDILRFHGIIWPAMLLSLELPVPSLLVNGWLLSDGFKMSKSLGNAVHLGSYGRDAFANIACRIANPGDDLNLSVKLLIERYNADLANGIGNLLSRTLAMIEKSLDSTIPAFHPDLFVEGEQALAEEAKRVVDEVCAAFDDFRIADALNRIWSLIALADKQITEQKPWALAKDPTQRQRLENVLAHAVGTLRTVALLAIPYFPAKMIELLAAIGEDADSLNDSIERARHFYKIHSGHRFSSIPRLFMRIDELPADNDAEEKQKSTQKSATKKREKNEKTEKGKTPAPQPSADADSDPGVITINDFAKVDLRVATVVRAEIVEGSDKLLRLDVSAGDLGSRIVFAGIRQWVRPEDIAGRKVLLVANLAPRKMKFGMSEGMILASNTASGGVLPVCVSDDLVEGARLS